MGKVPEYTALTSLNESMSFYCVIDSDLDGNYESNRVALSVLRASLYATGSKIFKLSKGTDIASASALALEDDGNYFDVTGTTGITSINTVQIGTVVVLQFDGVLTLTHHATNLILPTAANITTAAGDQAAFVEYDTGKWRCLWYTTAGKIPVYSSDAMRPVYIDAAPQALSGAGAVDIVSPITNVTTTGAGDALTLADATILGQMKVINHVVDGGSYVLTPTTLSGGATITVTDVGVSITLMWTASGWRLVEQTGVATIA